MDEMTIDERADGRANVFELLTTGLVIADGQDRGDRAVGAHLAIREVISCSCSNLRVPWGASDMLTDVKWT